MIKGEIPKE